MHNHQFIKQHTFKNNLIHLISTEENVQKVDEEVEELEKDLEDWNKTETINELKNVDKCSLGALRSARLALYKHKKAQKEKG